jgi:hypothetical protein
MPIEARRDAQLVCEGSPDIVEVSYEVCMYVAVLSAMTYLCTRVQSYTVRCRQDEDHRIMAHSSSVTLSNHP